MLCACPKANGHALAALSCEPRVLSQKEIMANSVDSVGKYIEVGRDDSYQSSSLAQDDVAAVLKRVVAPRATDNKTDLAIVAAGDFGEFKARVAASGAFDAHALGVAKVVFPALKNTELSKIFGAGKWQPLFVASTPSIPTGNRRG